ncbi:MAG: hypothetical protein EBS81_11635, partial [Gammaproteobacteria bacterium]|nr:hypothetical protein [Gammaproteobacteria bacterium]
FIFIEVSPYSLVVFLTDALGTAVQWGVEFTSRVHLTRRGFSPDFFEVGDEVTFSVSPYADGSPGGRFYWVKLANGRYYCDVGGAQRICQENNE